MQSKAVTGIGRRQRSECAALGVSFEGHELASATLAFDRRRPRAAHRDAVATGVISPRVWAIRSSFRISAKDRRAPRWWDSDRAQDLQPQGLPDAPLQAALQTLTRTGVKHAVVWLTQEPVPGVDPYYAGRFAAEAAANVLYRIPDRRPVPNPLLRHWAASLWCSRMQLRHGSAAGTQ